MEELKTTMNEEQTRKVLLETMVNILGTQKSLGLMMIRMYCGNNPDKIKEHTKAFERSCEENNNAIFEHLFETYGDINFNNIYEK